MVQGRFLFVNGNAADSARGVLSPLVQGRFLFEKFVCIVLIPLVQGHFLFRGYCFSSFVSIGWSDTFQVFVTQESCCLAATQIISGLFAASGSVSGQARVLSGLYLHGCFVLSRWAFKVLCARSIFMQGLSVVRDRFLGIIWLFFDECHRAAF